MGLSQARTVPSPLRGLIAKAIMLGRGVAGGVCFLLFAILLPACTLQPEPPTKLELTPVTFNQLPGWEQDKVREAWPALQSSCAVLLKQPAERARGITGTNADWQSTCQIITKALPADEGTARNLLQDSFTPYAVTNIDAENGLFTGYYEAQLNGALTQSDQFKTPLWQTPTDMITANLGDFKPELAGQKITGKVQQNKFVPYDDRAAIAAGSLAGRAEPLLWVDDAVDAFFLEIQGSGRVTLPDGSVRQVGYAAQNGRAYVPVGRILAERGAIERPVSMQKIRAWLAANPDQAKALMNENPSAVFFRELPTLGAVGAQGVVLTPGRSLAVDPAFVPLGTPLWLSTNNGLQKLMVAQDVGGAIKGPLRGDYFWGHGDQAEQEAGVMQARGTYYLLLPKTVVVP